MVQSPLAVRINRGGRGDAARNQEDASSGTGGQDQENTQGRNHPTEQQDSEPRSGDTGNHSNNRNNHNKE